MTRLEQRVYNVFRQKDLFVTLDSAMTYFTGMSRTQVENALESLCQQGKLYSTDTFVGKMYGYDSTEYCLADNALDVNISTGEGMESVIEALQNNDAVMIRATDLLPDFDAKTDQTQNLASVLSKIASKNTETETSATKTGTLFDWTFNSGLRAGERNWDVAIPDGFVKISSSSRRFELIPADARYRYSDDRPVEILPTENINGQDDKGIDVKTWFHHPLSNKVWGLIMSAYASEPQQINLNLTINGETRKINNFNTNSIPVKDIFGIPSKELAIGVVVQDIMGTNNFLINFYSDTQHKQIRVRTDHISEKNYNLIKQSIIRWASTFRFNKVNKKIPPLLIDDPICVTELKQGEMKSTLKALDIISRDVAAPGNAISDIGNILINLFGTTKTVEIVRQQFKDAMTVREFYIPKVEKLFSQVRDTLSAEKMLKLHKEYYGLSLTYLEAEIGDKHIRANLSAEAKKIVDKWAKEIKELEKPALYAEADKLSKKKSASDLRKAAQIFKDLKNYNDSAKRSKECTELADQLDKQEKYDSYTRSLIGCRNKSKLQELITGFRSLNGYKDATEKIKYCEQLIKDIDNEADYSKARKLIADETDRKKLEEANNIFTRLYNYKDSAELARKSRQLISDVPKAVKYKKANDDLAAAKNEKDKELAMLRFKSLSGYKDSVKKAESIASELEKARIRKMEKAYNDGVLEFKRKNYGMALGYFNSCIDWKDSKEYIEKCQSANKKGRVKFIIFLILMAFFAAGGYYFYINIYPEMQYKKALEIISTAETTINQIDSTIVKDSIEDIAEIYDDLIDQSQYEESHPVIERYTDKWMEVISEMYSNDESTPAKENFTELLKILIYAPQNETVEQVIINNITRWGDILAKQYNSSSTQKDKVYADMKEMHEMLTEIKSAEPDLGIDCVSLWNELWMTTIFNNPDHINKFVKTVEIEDEDVNSFYIAFSKCFESELSKHKNIKDLLTDTPLIESWIELLNLIPFYVEFENDDDCSDVRSVLYAFTWDVPRGSNIIQNAAHELASREDLEKLNNPKLKAIKDIIMNTDEGFNGLILGKWISNKDINGKTIWPAAKLEVRVNGSIKSSMFYGDYPFLKDGAYRIDSSVFFEITFVDIDNIIVHCHKNGITYKFGRADFNWM